MSLRYVQANGDTFIRHIQDTEPTVWDENNFCLARALTPEQAELFGVFELKIVTPPQFNAATQRCEEGPAILVNGVWTQNYVISELTAEEAAEKANSQAKQVRGERNAKLSETDWTRLDDAPLSTEQRAAWAVYRQQLRDLTDQPGFPWEITWPNQPV
jgi:hypothetical protein